MRVGILGSGLMGGKLGTIFARVGNEVIFSYARSDDKLKRLARDAKGKVRAGTPRDAAQEADALLRQKALYFIRQAAYRHQLSQLDSSQVISISTSPVGSTTP